jgi:LuxR family transcriptional regulator, quorum-sensing system regulator BjaR1
VRYGGYLMKLGHKAPQFTSREIEIMTWAAKGKTSPEISDLLSVTEDTVKTHIKNACRKLSASNKTHAIALALTMGLIASVQPNPQELDEA